MKNMKKTLYFALLLGSMLLTACEDNFKKEPESSGEQPEADSLSVVHEIVFVGSEGGSIMLSVESTVAWTASTEDSWLTLSKASGTGTEALEVLVANNVKTVSDTAIVSITNANGVIVRDVQIVRAPANSMLNGHEYVNLGLPSGTLWATCNVGANSPEEYGNFFAWAETEPKSIYLGGTLKYCTSFDDDSRTGTYSKYNSVDENIELDPEDDAATANWGNGWRTPNTDDLLEMWLNSTNIEWTSFNGVEGCKFTSKNGNSIFFPAAGYCGGDVHNRDGSRCVYWLSTLNGNENGAYCFDSASDRGIDFHYFERYFGLSVRPVVK